MSVDEANTSSVFPSFCSFQIILLTMDGQSPSLALSAAMSDNANKTLFLEKVRDSNHACQAGDFKLAVRLYTEAIALDPGNHILHSNRSAAYIKMGQFPKALQDAIRARDLNPEWPKAYYRQGVALQCLGKHSDALAAFANGLAQDPKSLQLLAGLIEAAMKSPLKGTLEPTYRQLQMMKLDKSPFVIISVIGQELLAQGRYSSAVEVLESALKIGTCSLKLRGSVFSALSSAYWALNSLDKAIGYMQQDLVVAKQLSDIPGECRAHGNLGSAYFSKGNYKEALTSHRYQLVLAMKCKDSHAASTALTSLGHVYTATGDYANALASHKQCVELVQQLNDRVQEARETGNVGAVYLAMGDFDKSVECHRKHLEIAKSLANKVEEARAYSNLGSAYHYKRSYEQAVMFHNQVLHLAQELKDKAIEARAYAGLGHAARCMGQHLQAKVWHEKQLDMALVTKDKVAEGRACSNLGIVYQLCGDHDAALKLHQAHLNIARVLHDRAGMGRAFGNIGNAYSASGFYEQAIKYHKQELTISKEVCDRNSEASTHGNLAVAYQALSMHEMALVHYHSHLNIARELKDSAGEALALCNLGNCHSSRGEFTQAVPFYENYLMLSQELNDVEGEAKACHFLGYAHYCLGNYKEAIRYYDQDLALARDQQDRMNMGRAYCNLGLAHLAIGNFESALECQKYFLAIAQVMKHNQGKFRALGNMGDVLLKMEDQLEEAISVYQKQLGLAKQIRDKGFEASAYGSLGICHRHAKLYDKALGFHTQELSILQDIADMRGECKAHGNLGAVHLSLGNYINAMKCYQEQLERAQDIKDSAMEAQSQGNLGLTKINLGRHEEAIGCFEQQLAALEQVISPSSPPSFLLEKGRAYGNLGSCYEALADYEESIKCHEHHLDISLKLKAIKDQDRAYRELGLAHKNLGNLQQALVCFEKRLVVAHDLSKINAKGTAYGDLGEIHALLGNFEQALSCLDHQLNSARSSNDRLSEAESASGLGMVHQKMFQWNSALQYHQLDLDISQANDHKDGQLRAMANIGATYEGMEDMDKALIAHENYLDLALQTNDITAQTRSLGGLGRLQHRLGNLEEAIAYLGRGLNLAEQSNRREDEARIRHRLGVIHWQIRNLDHSYEHLERAALLFETFRREAKGTSDYKLSLFDLQTECYHILQRVLVHLGRENEALVVAERARTRAFVDLLLERQSSPGSNATSRLSRLDESTPSSVNEIVSLVNRQNASVLYYSLAAGYLFVWLIIPTKGIVKFHQVCVSPEEGEENDASKGAMLEENIHSIREALGIQNSNMTYSGSRGDDENENGGGVDDLWSSHLDALGDKLNQESDRSGFLRMVNRSSRLNASSYSLSSLFSVGSVGAGSTMSGLTASSRHSTRSRRGWQGPSCLKKLYKVLIEPMEDELPENYPCELMLVLEGDLYLVPFAMLKGPTSTECLCERFSLITSPSLTSIKTSRSKNSKNSDQASAIVVGNPKIPSTISDQWGWGDIPSSGQEASIVAEIMQSGALTAEKATKEAILSQISQAECIHFSCHVSWKLSALVLCPGEFVESKSSLSGTSPTGGVANKRYSIHSDTIHEEEDVRSEVASSTLDMPSLSEFLLTAADILNLKLNAKLVVISSCYTKDEHGQITSDGLIALTRAFLAAGAQTVMVSLWPVPSTAVKLIMKAFYSSMLQGSRVSKALAEAMTTVQNTKQLQNPTNWAGFTIIGVDVKLTNKVALMGQALREILHTPESCRDALRVTLHLVEKSLQRLNRGYKNAMYTSQKSIENKVGSVDGWKDLLISVGFRFEPEANNIPASVFFPQSDPGERLAQCSASLQAILGLSQTSWVALSKLLASQEEADEIIALFRTVSVNMHADEAGVQVPVNVKLWQLQGCHELLASLGFDLMEVGKDDVILKTGKTANKRQIQFALQALVALFDTQDAPRSVEMDESSNSSLAEEDPESEHETEDESVDMISPASPFPLPRKSGVVLDGASGAFSSYVRSRGEPDGRQAGLNDSPPHPAFPQTSIPPPPVPPLPPMVLYQTHSKGHESDCNFTPSPVNPVPKSFLRNSYALGSPHHHNHAGPFAYGKRLSRNTMATPTEDKADSSSSNASSLADWSPAKNLVKKPNLHPIIQSRLDQALQEMSSVTNPGRPQGIYENHDMQQYSVKQPAGKPLMPIRSVFTDVGYHANQKITDKSDPNDKFSVRAETTKTISRKVERPVPADSRLNPGVTRRMPPTGESGSPESTLNQKRSSIAADTVSLTSSTNTFIVKSDDGNSSDARIDLSEINIHDSLRRSQFRDLRRDNPISEVYHERNIGLDLAPPLASIIMSNNLQVVQVDHHSDSEGSTKTLNKSGTSPNVEESMNSFDQPATIEKAHANLKLPPPMKRRPPIPPKPLTDSKIMDPRIVMTRDEGDGRSMTDSQYSGYSPNGQALSPGGATSADNNLASKIGYLRIQDYMNNQEIAVIEENEGEGNAAMKPKDIANYINTQFKMPNQNETANLAINQSGSSFDGNTKHPHNLWSRDPNGGLRYTGLFSSDC
ncbi:hypothetical protein TCAL_01247 [Tigriopus californicus]|uniref:Uncharacterized protein n=2 Tax=Tigriopus californicus TaxID=6832 RepID=A0A553NWY1_TIGCA|nr:hypothetical protein TCAL_01247 [Tigriopus californicus]